MLLLNHFLVLPKPQLISLCFLLLVVLQGLVLFLCIVFFAMFSPMANTRQAPQQSCPQRRPRRITNPPPPPPPIRPQPPPRRPYNHSNHRPLFPLVPDLPDEVIEQVFAFLPIEHAVKAGIVGKKYARSWTLSRHLVFDMNNLIYRTDNLVRVIDGVFGSHNGPEIESFTLIMDPLGVDPSKIENWIRICVQKGLENLDLSFFHLYFRIGGEILEIPTLKTLKLNNCIIHQMPPNSDTALQNLNTMVLKKVQLEDTVLHFLVFCCKMLGYLEIIGCSGFENVFIYAKEHRHFKTLKIGDCSEVQRVAIDAPTLKSFFYCGSVPIMRLIGCGQLDEAYVHFVPPRTQFITALTMDILAADLFHVTVLTISAQFIEALAARIRDTGFFQDAEFTLLNLKELQVFMEGGIFCDPFDIAMFLRHCPNLDTLYIDMTGYYFDGGAYWMMHQKPYLNNFNHYFNRLRFVKLLGFKFMGPDIDLAKVILKNSTMLEALFFIAPRYGRRRYTKDINKYFELFHSWKVSPAAGIVLYENRYDNSGLFPTHNKFWC